ncbi:MAG: cation diffusion facilitator family transporter [Spirochaetales bacterium]
MENRSSSIKKASWIALCGNIVLAFSKIVIGFISGSLAVLSDGIDSATDVLIAAMTLVAARISVKPGDNEHPYGHGRIETVATAVISFIVFFAGAQVLFNAVGRILSGGAAESLPSTMAVWVTIASIAGKLALAWSQFYFGKKSGSPMLIANGKNMRGDVVTSAAVLLGLGLTYLTGIPIMDKILAAIVALWILKNAVEIFLEANTELMDGTSDREPYKEIFAAVARVPEAGNPHRARLRRIGSMLVVDLDIEVEPAMKVSDAHAIAVKVEESIKESLPDIYDVIVHIEPFGNVEDERFGLRAVDTED